MQIIVKQDSFSLKSCGKLGKNLTNHNSLRSSRAKMELILRKSSWTLSIFPRLSCDEVIRFNFLSQTIRICLFALIICLPPRTNLFFLRTCLLSHPSLSFVSSSLDAKCIYLPQNGCTPDERIVFECSRWHWKDVSGSLLMAKMHDARAPKKRIHRRSQNHFWFANGKYRRNNSGKRCLTSFSNLYCVIFRKGQRICAKAPKN